MTARPSHPYRTRRPLAAAAAAALLALVSACGGSDGSAETASGTSSEVTPKTSQTSPEMSAETSPEAAATAPAEPGSSAAESGESSASTEQTVIRISDFSFSTPPSVAPGAEVTVVNDDSSFHTVTAADGSFDVAAPSGTVTFTAPDEPGEYAFACTPHPNMTGTLVVA